MFERTGQIYLISSLSFFFTVGLVSAIYGFLTTKRARLLERLENINLGQLVDDEEVLQRPFLERTVGAMSRWLVKTISQLTPQQAIDGIAVKLEKAGNPHNLKASDFLALQGILGLTTLVATWFLLGVFQVSAASRIMFPVALAALVIYLPWFTIATIATKRQKEIRKSLPDIMDLLVVSVEAGLSFDMALLKVVERFKGIVADEFHRALREMQLGKPRKDALKAVAGRVSLAELSALVNAIIQSDQLGVGLGSVLRLQADMIRTKRQMWIEEQAIKAPIKMLFPLVFFIFPCIFIIILGPAILNIMKVLGNY